MTTFGSGTSALRFVIWGLAVPNTLTVLGLAQDGHIQGGVLSKPALAAQKSASSQTCGSGRAFRRIVRERLEWA